MPARISRYSEPFPHVLHTKKPELDAPGSIARFLQGLEQATQRVGRRAMWSLYVSCVGLFGMAATKKDTNRDGAVTLDDYLLLVDADGDHRFLEGADFRFLAQEMHEAMDMDHDGKICRHDMFLACGLYTIIAVATLLGVFIVEGLFRLGSHYLEAKKSDKTNQQLLRVLDAKGKAVQECLLRGEEPASHYQQVRKQMVRAVEEVLQDRGGPASSSSPHRTMGPQAGAGRAQQHEQLKTAVELLALVAPQAWAADAPPPAPAPPPPPRRLVPKAAAAARSFLRESFKCVKAYLGDAFAGFRPSVWKARTEMVGFLTIKNMLALYSAVTGVLRKMPRRIWPVLLGICAWLFTRLPAGFSYYALRFVSACLWAYGLYECRKRVLLITS